MNRFIGGTSRVRSLRSILAVFAFLYSSVLVVGARTFDNPKGSAGTLIAYNVEGHLVAPKTDQHEHGARQFVSDHEIPEQIPTRVKIAGDLATPGPDSNISVDFVPKQTYVQVRRYDAEVHLPRRVALEEARTEEEVVNAPRLREVISHTKKQEVYEEQGYEDTGYDHGGYKKAAQHHEKKIIPGEYKTENELANDQSTKQEEVIHVPHSNITYSSQSETRISTQGNAAKHTRRPKVHNHSTYNRPKQPNWGKVKELGQTRLNNRRHHKPLQKQGVIKIAEQSKHHTTRRMITELDITPTTYRPVPIKFVTTSTKIMKLIQKPFHPPKISQEGYKFEDPFEHFKDSSHIKLVTHPSTTIKTILPETILHLKPPQYQVHEIIKYGENKDAGRTYPRPTSKLQYPAKTSYSANNQRKIFKSNFPYKIINQKDNLKHQEDPVKSYYNHKYEKQNKSFFFGLPDPSPWIPLTTSDVYKTHNLNQKHASSNVIKEDTSYKKTAPIRVYDLPKTVSTSYTIHHVYQPHQPEASHHTAGSIGWKMSADSLGQSSVTLDSQRSKPYDIITADSENITNTLNQFGTAQKDSESLEEDIETMSSHRYPVFQRPNRTTPLESSTSSLNEVNDEFNRLYNNEQAKFLFRHPYLSRETSQLLQSSHDQALQNTTTKRDIVLTNLSHGDITHTTKVAKRNNNSVKPILVYPQDYLSSAKYVEKLTLAHYSLPQNTSYNQLPLEYQNRLATLTTHLKNDTRVKRQVVVEDEDENEELVSIFISGTTTQIPVNMKKYPFYKVIPNEGLSKYSVLRYISNPEDIPRKMQDKMAFYKSKNHIQCAEPTAPQNIVPNRGEGEWTHDPQPEMPRIKLGDKISCLKIKFFGKDPLDNPFFKEDKVGFPKIFQPSHAESAMKNKNDDVALKQKPRKRKRRPRTKQMKRAISVPEITINPIRHWIDSLAVPITVGPISERSTVPQNKTDAKVQKIFFVGGFINQKNKHAVMPTSELPVQNAVHSQVEQVKHFNDQLNFTPDPFSSEGESDYDDEEKEEDSLNGFTEITKLNDIVTEKSEDVQMAPRTINTSNKLKKYVDASTFQRFWPSMSTSQPSTEAAVSRKLIYKEPTWRSKKPKSQVPMEIDSLLYVIHLQTGEGRWMRLMKIEKIDDDEKKDALASSNNEATNTIASSQYQREHTTTEEVSSQAPYHEESSGTKITLSSDYDVYRISDLMKQVAPLKASHVEINNLMKTGETDIKDVEDAVDDASNLFYNLNDFPISTQFPEPHERHYYYVVDDNDKE